MHELGLLTEEYKLYHWAIWKRFQDKHDEIGSDALQLYNARAGYEEKVAGGKHTYAELFQSYLSYINFEESSGDPARVQILYDKAITEFPVANDLWLSYTQYLDSNSKVPSIIKSVYSRAIRNCPWVEALWATYMLAL